MQYELIGEPVPVASFDDMITDNDNLLRGIYAYGFETPSAVQQRAIMPIIHGHDTITQAQAGTGKTTLYDAASWIDNAHGP